MTRQPENSTNALLNRYACLFGYDEMLSDGRIVPHTEPPSQWPADVRRRLSRGRTQPPMTDWKHWDVEIPAEWFVGRIVRATTSVYETSQAKAKVRAEREEYSGDLTLEYEDGRSVRVSPTGYEVEGLAIDRKGGE